MLRMATVCSGIGAPEAAAAGLGIETVWQSEIEAFPAAVLAKRYPGAWRVIFEPPCCCLAIPRVMPGYVLTVIDPAPVETGQSQLRLPMGQEAS